MILALPLGSQVTILSEPLGEWIVINLELSDSLVLIRGNSQELCLSECCSGVEVVGHHVLQSEDIRGGDSMETNMILVHRGQNNLSRKLD